jgi:predicted extracellular nuclease
MEVYSGKGKDGADFSSVDDLQVGDIVTVKGNVKMYSSTPEFIRNNQIVSFERKELAEPELSFGETTAFSIKLGDNFTAPTLTFAEGFDGTVT